MGIPEEIYVEELNVKCFCPICLDVFLKPVKTDCNHVFCGSCIRTCIADNSNDCPLCRRSLKLEELKPHTQMERRIDEFMVYCDEDPALRCGWTGFYSTRGFHLRSCKTHQGASGPSSSPPSSSSSSSTSGKENNSTGGGQGQAGSAARRRLSKLELNAFSVKKLLGMLKEHRVRHSCVEKNDLVQKVYSEVIATGKYTQRSNTSDGRRIGREERKAQLKQLSVSRLLRILRARGVDFENCVEKTDLVELVLQATFDAQTPHVNQGQHHNDGNGNGNGNGHSGNGVEGKNSGHGNFNGNSNSNSNHSQGNDRSGSAYHFSNSNSGHNSNNFFTYNSNYDSSNRYHTQYNNYHNNPGNFFGPNNSARSSHPSANNNSGGANARTNTNANASTNFFYTRSSNSVSMGGECCCIIA